jgi:hypothetical protein
MCFFGALSSAPKKHICFYTSLQNSHLQALTIGTFIGIFIFAKSRHTQAVIHQ